MYGREGARGASCDLRYANTGGNPVAKEVKAMSSANVGTVTARIMEADNQLRNRVADKKKILIRIEKSTISGPA